MKAKRSPLEELIKMTQINCYVSLWFLSVALAILISVATMLI
jgi:hypothetical protein